MVFTINEAGNDSDMQITGVYEERLQYGVFTLIKGLGLLADKIAAAGAAGHYSAGPIHAALPTPTPAKNVRRLPRRLARNSGFGDL